MRGEIAVFDANAPPALAFVRSLGDDGFKTCVYSPLPVSIAGSSRFCRRREHCPSLLDYDAFLPWLRDKVGAGDIRAIAPTSDLLCFYIAMVRDLFEPDVDNIYPSKQDFLGVLFKDRFSVPPAGDIRTPETFVPSSAEEARDFASEFAYPALIKPRSHVATPQLRGQVVSSAEELIASYAPLPVADGLRPVLDLYPELEFPVVQEFVTALPEDLVTVSGLLGPDGTPVALLGAKKFAQWPPKLGIGLVFQNADISRIEHSVSAFVQDRIGRGMFELELIPDHDDGWIAIDLNPRGFGQIHFDIARGADLCALWARSLTGASVEEMQAAVRPIDTSLKFAHGVLLAAKALVQSTRPQDRKHALRNFRRDAQGAVGIIHEDRDPVPSAVYLATMLRHPGGLVRPFLKTDR